jgi:hypothetical protein
MPPTLPAATAWLGTWSRPPDRPAQVALGAAVALAAVALTPGGARRLASFLDVAGLADLTRRRRFLTVAPLFTAFLSLAYIAFYLRGGPRAPEAAVYWLQGRAMSHGDLSWAVPGPTVSFRARGLLLSPSDRLSAIVAPGYPLLLAATFLVGAPMLVGPLLAAGLVAATWMLARELAADSGERPPRDEMPRNEMPRNEMIARAAAGLSVVSAALRYHTADALPHGAAALAIAVTLSCALRARRTGEPRLFGVAGLSLGLLAATAPASCVAVGVATLAIALRGPRRARAAAWACAAALPGVFLLLAADRAATGHAFASPDFLYFTTVEPHSLVHEGAKAAAMALLRSLRAHTADVANFEPLALLALLPLVGKPRRRGALLAALVIAGHTLIHAGPLVASDGATRPGVSVLAEMLPVEHALIALGLSRWFPRAFAAAATATLAFALGGFALHTSYDHERFAEAGIGRPRFEPDVAREANVTHGLLFFDDDQGYALAYDPAVPASHGVEAVRLRGDDHDRLLYDSLGHPAVHRYVAEGPDGASLASWTPSGGTSDTWRFESESDWPPIRQAGGRAELIEAAGSCASGGRALALAPAGGAEATAWIELPVPRGPTPPEARAWTVTPRAMLLGTASSATLTIRAGGPTAEKGGGEPVASWSWTDAANLPSCLELSAKTVELGGGRARAWLVLTARGGAVALDETTLRGR